MDQYPKYSQHLNELDKIKPLQGKYKILTEIARSKLSFHFSKKIKMNKRVIKILELNWSLHPADYRISLTANRLWISGRISADITYTKGIDGQVSLQTIFFPWKTTAAFEYSSPPVIPRSNEKKQYEFNGASQAGETDVHYEQFLFYNEMPLLEIIAAKVVTSQSISKTEEVKNLFLDVNCELEYRILQNQFMHNEP